MTVIVLVAAVVLLILVSSYGLYRLAFYLPTDKRPEAHHIPDNRFYRLHKEKMQEVVDVMDRTPCEEVEILSEDGLRLYGRLFLIKEEAPLILFFHGYHGTAAWDGHGLFKLCTKNGLNLLMIDQRAQGKSGGNVITLGIRERYDCKSWAEYAAERFGEHTDIFLAGVSMGAATVMMSSALGLPGNVRGIIADCGYSEPAAIIVETVRATHLPVKPVSLLIRLGARLFGHFDPAEATALQAVGALDRPILFIHGSQDSAVPLAMGEALYKACQAKKEWVVIEGADHANCAMTDYASYEKAVLSFIGETAPGGSAAQDGGTH